MSALLVLSVLIVYFGILIFISYLTSRKTDSSSFFTANRKSPWYLVAFGMIGTSISGVTFISIPGEVYTSGFSYYQMVLGYLLGYAFIGLVLLPLYYRLNLVTIYTYLLSRFGKWSHKTGAFFFLVSRVIGSSFRLFLVAVVLQISIFDSFNFPFYLTVSLTLFLIWLYTFKAGIKTVVWTDVLQTFFFIAAVILTIIFISNELNYGFSEMVTTVYQHQYSDMFVWDWTSKRYFFKMFFAGMFIAITMTGLDQDMMQKNLTCKNIKDARKNMFWFSLTLLPINLLFLCLGVLLYIYASSKGITLPESTDALYPMLAVKYFSTFAGIVFLIGIIAAAFSSADSSITSLTTSLCVDFLKLDITEDSVRSRRTKLLSHIGISLLFLLVIIAFRALNNQSVISQIFSIAGYTYGPLLGIFFFGLFTRYAVYDKLVPVIAIISPAITYVININSKFLFFGYEFGYELLILNGAITFLGMLLIRKKEKK